MYYDDPLGFLGVTSLIAAVGVIVSSFEMLSNRSHCQSSGLFSWEMQRGSSARLYLPRVDNLVFEYPNVLWFIGIRIVAACSIPLVLANRIYLLIASLVIALVSVLLTVRGGDGRNGSDQMTSIIFVSLALSLLSSNPMVWKAELWFLALQLNLSYLTSGIVKAREPNWRNGSYLRMAVRTKAYGNEAVWKLFVKRPGIARIASMMVIILECGFFVSLFLPLNYSWPILIAGVVFHIANAIISGLNTFVWSYLALYPAVVFCSHSLGGAVLGR